MALVPQVCDAVSVPVVAAGGIGDGRGVAAAFMLGACGVQLGTRFLVSKECKIHPNYKNKILKAKDLHTIATGKRNAHPVRSLKSPFSKEFFKKEYDSVPVSDEDLETFGAGALRLAAKEGDEAHGCFMAGQIAALVRKEQTAREIIEEIFSEAQMLLGGASKWVK
jgi:enoyl-[acyl-carrier protein] reductase II